MKHDVGEADQVVNNALLGLYVEIECFDEVLKVFEAMPQRNVVLEHLLVLLLIPYFLLFKIKKKKKTKN